MDKIKYFYECCETYKEIWLSRKNECPLLLKLVNSDKKNNEIKVSDLIDKVINHIDKFPSVLPKKKVWKVKGDTFINKLIENDNMFKLQNMKKEMRKEIIVTTKRFIKEARNFDSDLKLESIMQALRNVWIISILQGAIEERQDFSNALFGYSMLYPYTDNFLDDVNIKLNEKQKFNLKLYEMLSGNKDIDLSEYEKKVFRLVNSIEDTYNRDDYPYVYKSLLLIYDAQNKSLNQQSLNNLDEEKILEISIEKGGSSVLVDGFLVSGDLTHDEIRFCIGYGIFLQLADDLQDLKEDIKNNHNTIMTMECKKGYLDSSVDRLLSFMYYVLNDYKWNDNDLKEIVEYNCIMLVLFSVIFNKEYFSEEYAQKASKYLPFSIEFIEKKKSEILEKVSKTSFYKDNKRVMSIIDEIVM